MNKDLLELRKRIKRRKPVFARKDSNKKKRIESDVWRRPRGVDNKQRLKKKGHKKNPSTGYKSPLLVRGLHPSGLNAVVISHSRQLVSIKKEQGLIIASGLGDKKRLTIIDEALKRGLAVLNLDPHKKREQIIADLKHRALAKSAEEKDKKESKVEKPELQPEKKLESASKKEEPEMDEEEKRKLEKQEKDKILTKKV